MATFTAVGRSAATPLKPGQILAVAISGTYAATLKLVRSFNGGASYEDVQVGPFSTANATVGFNYTADREQIVQLVCSAFTSGTVTYTLTTVRTNRTGRMEVLDEIDVIENKPVNAATGSGTALQTLATGTIPAGTLKNVGDTVYILAAFKTAANVNNKTIHLKVGSATTFASAAAGHNAKVGFLEGWLTKTGLNTQDLLFRGQISTTVIEPVVLAATETESGEISVLAQATDGTDSAGDVTFMNMRMQYIPVPKELL